MCVQCSVLGTSRSFFRSFLPSFSSSKGAEEEEEEEEVVLSDKSNVCTECLAAATAAADNYQISPIKSLVMVVAAATRGQLEMMLLKNQQRWHCLNINKTMGMPSIAEEEGGKAMANQTEGS